MHVGSGNIHNFLAISELKTNDLASFLIRREGPSPGAFCEIFPLMDTAGSRKPAKLSAKDFSKTEYLTDSVSGLT